MRRTVRPRFSWARVFQLWSLVVSAGVVAVYLLGYPLPRPFPASESATLAADAAIVFGFLLFLELVRLLGAIPVLRDFYENRGLVGLNRVALLLCLSGLGLAYLRGWLYPGLVAAAIALLASTLTDLWRLHTPGYVASATRRPLAPGSEPVVQPRGEGVDTSGQQRGPAPPETPAAVPEAMAAESAAAETSGPEQIPPEEQSTSETPEEGGTTERGSALPAQGNG